MKECYETNVGLRLGEEKGWTNNLKVTNPTPLFFGPYRRYGVIFCIMQMFHKSSLPILQTFQSISIVWWLKPPSLNSNLILTSIYVALLYWSKDNF